MNISSWQNYSRSALVIIVVLAASAIVGSRSPGFSDQGSITMQSVAPLLAGFGILSAFGASLINLRAAVALLIMTSGLIDIPLGTGTQTTITTAMLVLPTIVLAWVLQWLLVRRTTSLGDPRINVPVMLFVAVLLLSWAANAVLMDVRVILPSNAVLVQGTQVALYVLNLAALLLAASVRWTERALQICVAAMSAMSFISVAAAVTGVISVGPIVPAVPMSIGMVVLLGQLILNPRLNNGARLLGWVLVVGWSAGTFLTFRSTYAGGWVPVVFALPIIIWLRSKRLAVMSAIAAGIVGWFNQSLFMDYLSFKDSVGSLLRPYIWLDVVRMAFDSAWHVLLGLGPVNYKWNWFNPDFVSISKPMTGASYVGTGDASVFYAPPSHNFYADLMAQTGILGVLAFAWLMIVLWLIGARLIARLPSGFARAYAGSVLAAYFGMMVVSMVSAEWLVTFVYNLGTVGFRQSIYTWLLLGTLVSLDRQGLAGESDDVVKEPVRA